MFEEVKEIKKFKNVMEYYVLYMLKYVFLS